MIRSILSVGGWTLVSRVTGFLRDVVMAAVMGAGPIADAFVVAFRLPNHFRAIFGEGAFNVAFVPTYAGLDGAGEREDARRFADRIFTLMLLIQVALLALALPMMPLVVRALAPGFAEEPEKFALAVALTRITFPYLLFITLVTLLSGVLNARKRFAAAAAAPVLLNLSLLASLALAFLFPNAAYAAAWGVAVSGVLQFLLVWGDAVRAGVAPRLARPTLADTGMVRFFRMLGPAVIGSAGVQIAMFADTIIASFLPAGAVSALYYADRLYQLPFGVIGIAAGTVLLPEMSRRLASGDAAAAHAAQNRATGFSLALSAPFAVAFLLVPDLIMTALFQRGAFDAEAAARAGAVLAAYGLALPAAVLIRSIVASFYARQDSRFPVVASLTAVALNVALKVALTGPLGVTGLALATAAGVWVNVLMLFLVARRRGWTAPSRALAVTACGVLAGCAVLALGTLGGLPLLERLMPPLPRFRELAILSALGGLGLLAYAATLLAALRLFRVPLRRV
ncbi:integral membrane protein MviN [Methylobacterium sp. 4-46]|uniref:murein biosynthesis integral membrane protein MurJ n=1 Tax=unclassified Methylobacterium TaxID=2615210 RepID=UPI000152DA20|nr:MULTISPECIES: murein biosynthesis integral membrane protein MurJ [Methylobacterium]ACA19623.1 integral membrane protein MviN [Methylobacterium sp. 4-46]WFT78819.1 murein biosynthesis integral membrane protein MurJ [Methylobacterium nodulans]